MLAGCCFIRKCECVTVNVCKCKGNLSTLGYKEFIGFITEHIGIIKNSKVNLVTLIAVGHIEGVVIPCLYTNEAVVLECSNKLAVYKFIGTDVIDINSCAVILAVDVTEEVILRLGYGTDGTYTINEIVIFAHSSTLGASAVIPLMVAVLKTDSTISVKPEMLAFSCTGYTSTAYPCMLTFVAAKCTLGIFPIMCTGCFTYLTFTVVPNVFTSL